MFRLIAVSVLIAVNAMPVFADHCDGQKWCVEKENFAFRIGEQEITIDLLRNIPQGNPETIINYLIEHGDSRLFLAWLRPIPEMRVMQFSWNVGLQLASGDVVWADKWFVANGMNEFQNYGPKANKLFIPGSNGTSPGGHSFLFFLAMPSRAYSGKEWRKKDASGLVIK